MEHLNLAIAFGSLKIATHLIEERKMPVDTKDQNRLLFAVHLNSLLFGSNEKNMQDKENFLNLLLSTGKATLNSLEFKKFVQPLQQNETVYTLVVEGHKKYKSVFLNSADKRLSLFKMFIDYQIPYEGEAFLHTKKDLAALIEYLKLHGTETCNPFIEYIQDHPTYKWTSMKNLVNTKISWGLDIS